MCPPSKKHKSEYYEEIDGVKYDTGLLNMAKEMKEAKKLDKHDAIQLWESAKDGPGVTDTERATLQYLLKAYTFTEKGEEFIRERTEVQSSGTGALNPYNSPPESSPHTLTPSPCFANTTPFFSLLRPYVPS